MERRLTAILAADVVGYSRLMGVDEAGTLAALKAVRQDLIEPKAAQYNGRTIKLMGDGALMEFASVVDAVAFAVEVQCAMRERNTGVPEERQIRYRIGINIGDVIVEDDDIYGDGVNVAARLEGLADPDGICLSGSAHAQVKGKLDLTFEHRGRKEVKNIAEPVTVFAVVLDDKSAGLVTPTVEQKVNPSRKIHRRGKVIAAAVVTLAVVVGGTLWWQLWQPDVAPASIENMAFPLPDMPSVAVLPFANMSDDPEQEYFADGMTEDLITDLSMISGLFVIARNSAFGYRDRSAEVRRAAEELGVRYVLTGSVRRSGDGVRINAQLVDALSGRHLWGDRYDGSLGEVFALHDQVTASIVSALAVRLTDAEQPRRGQPRTDVVAAYEAFLRGWWHYRRNTPDDFAKAIPYFEEAIALDADYSRADAALATVYWSVVDKNWSTGTSAWSRTLGITTNAALTQEGIHLERALKHPLPLAHQVAAGRFSRQGLHEAAIREAGRAIALDPNDPVGYEAMAAAQVYAGLPDEAAGNIGRAMRLDPGFPHEYLYWLGLAQFGLERFEDAAETLTRAAQGNPDDDRSFIVLASAYGHLGQIEDAKSATEKANQLREKRQPAEAPGQAGITALLVGPYTLQDLSLWPFKKTTDRERLRLGLQFAGVPETGQADDESPIEVAGAAAVNAEAARALFDRGVPFVDVRGEASWRNGHIPGAVNLDLKNGFTVAALSAVVDRDQEVVIYCMGPRCLLSSEASAKAVAWGFTNVYYFRAGFPSWKEAGYAVAVP